MPPNTPRTPIHLPLAPLQKFTFFFAPHPPKKNHKVGGVQGAPPEETDEEAVTLLPSQMSSHQVGVLQVLVMGSYNYKTVRDMELASKPSGEESIWGVIREKLSREFTVNRHMVPSKVNFTIYHSSVTGHFYRLLLLLLLVRPDERARKGARRGSRGSVKTPHPSVSPIQPFCLCDPSGFSLGSRSFPYLADRICRHISERLVIIATVTGSSQCLARASIVATQS